MSEQNQQSDYNPVMYTPEEIECLETHIEKYYGKFEGVFHELISPDIHVDIAMIAPGAERNYWVMVTMGMGAKPMNVPSELKEYRLERAEIMICLPPDWEIENNDEEWYWPLRWLKIMARLPGDADTWLGWGHSVPKGEPMASNTALSGVMLVNPGAFETEAYECELPNGDVVNFYQMLPLYDEEMNYKLENGAEALLSKMDDEMLEYMRPDRKNACL